MFLESLVVIISIVILVFIVFSCLECRRLQETFNRGASSSTTTLNTSRPNNITTNEYGMYPPGESTPATPGSAVEFAPLPLVKSPLQDFGIPLIERENVLFVSQIGTGTFGQLLVGELKTETENEQDRIKVAIKVLSEDCSHEEQTHFLDDARTYSRLKHYNIIQLYNQCSDRMPFLLVYEYLPVGDLKWYLLNHQSDIDFFNTELLHVRLVADIIAGLQCMHQHNFIHQDLAARICYVAADYTVKLSDYGIAPNLYPNDYALCGPNKYPVPLRWLSPESVTSEEGNISMTGVTKETNIWSFAVCMWEIMHFGAQPHSEYSNEQLCSLSQSERSELVLDYPKFPLKHADKLYELCTLCWQKSSRRPSVHTLQAVIRYLLTHSTSNDADFNARWHQLLPRTFGRSPALQRIQNSSGDVQTEIDSSSPVSSSLKPNTLSTSTHLPPPRSSPSSGSQNAAFSTPANSNGISPTHHQDPPKTGEGISVTIDHI